MANAIQEKKQQARAVGMGVGPLLNAAAVAQAQNQQPDSIPGMFKPGEFVLPPDTVHALGGKAVLQDAVNRTHTPSDAGAMIPAGFKPELFFANGGAPEDELKKANSFGDAAAVSSTPGMKQVPAGVGALSSTQTFNPDPLVRAGTAPLMQPNTPDRGGSFGTSALTNRTATPTSTSAQVPDSLMNRASSGSPQTNKVSFDPSTNTYSGGNAPPKWLR